MKTLLLPTANAEFRRKMKDEVFKTWYRQRPPHIRELVRQYPFDYYRIKEGAPYSISAPGCKVELISYTDSGRVSVVVNPGNYEIDSIIRIRHLGQMNNRDVRGAIKHGTRTYVDPQWLEPITKQEYNSIKN